MSHSTNPHGTGVAGDTPSSGVATNVFATARPGIASSAHVTINSRVTHTPDASSSTAAWAVRGIHANALLWDHGGNYAGADDTAKTAALQAKIATAAGGTGTTGLKYQDGVHGELASINSTNTLDGHAVIRMTQPNGTANTPQLWASLPRHVTGYWERFKFQMPAGWTPVGSGVSDPGYKQFGNGFAEYDGRSSLEWTNGQQFLRYTVVSKSTGRTVGGVNEMTYKTESIPLASGPSTVMRDLIVCNYSPMTGFWRTLVWAAADGSQPQLVLDSWAGMARGTIPTIDRIQLGINLNMPSTADKYWDLGEWQLIDYADNADPWGLVALAGGSIGAIRMPSAMTLTGVSGTVDATTGGTLVLTGTGFNPSLPSYHFISLYDADGDTPMAVSSFTVDSSTQITVHLTTGGAPTGTYHIGVQTVGITAGIPPCANTPPVAFTVTSSGGSAPTLSSVSPATLAQSATAQDLVLMGANFVSGQSVTISNAGVTVNSVTVNSSTQITANVTVSNTATVGAGTIKVHDATNGDSGTKTFTVAAGSPISSGLVLWLDASAGTSTTTDNTTLASWKDQSGTGALFSQATSGSRPTYIASALNAKPGIRFGGAHSLAAAGVISALNGTAWTIVAVQKMAAGAPAADQRMFDNANDAGFKGYGIGFHNAGSNNQHQGWYATGSAMHTLHGGTATTAMMVLVGADAAGNVGGFSVNAGLWIDGTATDGTPDTLSAQSTKTPTIGVDSDTGLAFATGDLYELLVFNFALSSAQVASVHTYLSTKYGTA